MGYLGNPSTITGSQNYKRLDFTATASQTSFQISGGYPINGIDVYRNGVKLANGKDFTASDGNYVNLLSAANENDSIGVVIVENFNVADAVTGSGDQTIAGKLTVEDLSVTGAGASFADNSILYFGTGNDLQIQHEVVGSGGTSYILDKATGNLVIGGDSNVTISDAGGTQTKARFITDGASELYQSGSKKFETDPAGVKVTGDVISTGMTATGQVQLTNVNVAAALTGTTGYFSSNVTIGGTLTYEDVTNIDSVGLITARNGLQVLAGITTIAGQSSLTNVNVSSALTATNTTLGFTTFSEAIDIESATETVAVAATSPALSPGGRVIVECDAASASVFTYACSNGEVGIVSFKNFPVSKNQINTYTILFTQNATGTGNTTNTVGIGTSVTLNPLGVSGFSTSARVASASTITLTNNANDIDVVTFAIHYNGGGTGTAGNYTVLATKNNGYRYGSIGF